MAELVHRRYETFDFEYSVDFMVYIYSVVNLSSVLWGKLSRCVRFSRKHRKFRSARGVHAAGTRVIPCIIQVD
jgi:hypothetical protein